MNGNRSNSEQKNRDGKRRFSRDTAPRVSHRSSGNARSVQTSKKARDAALSAVQDVFANDAYASQALSRQLSTARLNEEDRRFATSLFYHVIENRLAIEFLLDHLLETRPDRICWDILCLAAAQILYMDGIPNHAAVDEAVKQTRASGREGMTGMVNGVLRALVLAKETNQVQEWMPDPEGDPVGALSIRCSVAQPVAHKLIEAYGMEEAERILSWKPDVYWQTIRPNEMLISIPEFEAYLSKCGVVWAKGLVEGAYRCASSGDLTRLDGYRQGLFSIQSESSMLAALAVEPKPGQFIVDACAAPGGKTALIAERMKGTGRVYAWDVHPHRVELIKAAVRRLQLDNVRPSLHDARKPMDSMQEMADAVLVDAPCSGLGVLTNKPDIKYRTTEQSLATLLPLQSSILDACACLVKPGGLLVYSTCTILPEENVQQVQAFLERHSDFTLCMDNAYLPLQLRPHFDGGMLQLRQNRDGVEGFFICRMRRKTR